MKPANQNEIDILLRSLARRDGGLLSDTSDSGGASSEHLDADELNAFAEGMVTDRARVRYSAHLADCANCRSVVVSLTQSAGLAAALSPTKDSQAGISFWRQITAIFSHPALRVAVPAVVFAAIIGIVVIALRQDNSNEFVARHDPVQTPAPDQMTQAVPLQTPLPSESTNAGPAAPATTVNTPAPVRRGESAGTAGLDAASEGPAILRKESVAKSAEPASVFAPDLSAPAAPPPMPAYAEGQRAQTLARDEQFKRESETRQKAIANTQTDDSAVDNNKAPSAGAASSQPKRKNVQGLLREGRAYEDKDKADRLDESESRTVSGKRFTRQNNSWVDASYQQSTTTNVRRGSEQYRALIADEPGLRTFAEQLSGPVIVVWKGRAYKFY